MSTSTPTASMLEVDATALQMLIVDDDVMVVTSLTELLSSMGYELTCAEDVEGARKALATKHFDAILCDVYLPDGNGLTVLERAMENDPPPQVIMMTARAEIRAAVDAIRQGAADFLEKPLDLDDLSVRLDRVLANAVMRRRLAALEAKEHRETSVTPRSSALKDALSIAARVAATPSSSALLLGESGVGKEVLATRIHELSERRSGPFIRVNLAAIPETMIEAELFGSVRGAFTDSKRDRAGHFASAEGGTLLLDEVCELKVELQPKLLRALEERRFYPVGSDRERRMNVRVLAATNRDPKEMIAAGTLREDLYYRLSTVSIKIAPLRSRVDDIVPLAQHFAAHFRDEFRRPKCVLGEDALHSLTAYPWPGNVRELRNVIERAMMLCESDEIGPADLDLAVAPSKREKQPLATEEPCTLDEVEKRHIHRVLENANGSRTRAAAILGISRSTLQEKLKRYAIL